MEGQVQRRRYRYLNLLQIRLPLPGFVSILHRVSGVLLILALPFALAALQFSITNEADYQKVVDFLS